MTDPVEIARTVAEVASDRLASDITVLDISKLSTIADVFVVCTGWILMDYGDVIVHLFTTDQRDFYRLDDLWAEAPTLLKIQ